MWSHRERWWNAGEAQAIAIYRAKLAIPALVLSLAIVLPILIFPDMRQPGTGVFLLCMWITFMSPLLVRFRRAAIFTPDVFLYRPALGRALKVPLKGIKRAG